MTLVEHLRELRNRLFFALLAVLAGAVVAWIYYDPIFTFVSQPFFDAAAELEAKGLKPILSITGVADAFNLRLQVSFVFGVIVSSPIWIYQLLRFVAPGLHRNERRWALISACACVPLFLAGVALAYVALPHVLGAFLGFTPEGTTPIIDVERYLTFLLQISLAFGIGFLAPVVVVALNALGVLSARRFASWWRWVLLGTLVFAAVATPTADPINLMLFASPILVLMLAAFAICWLNDRRRARRDRLDGLADLDDDETSPLTIRRVESDDVPSDLS